MNLIDASVWLEYFAGGPQAGQFASVIEQVDALLVPTIVLLEVTRRVMQQRDEDAALQIAAMLHQRKVVPLDAGIALSAAQLGVAHTLPLVDRIIYATAKQYQATVWTMDAHFAALAGVRYIPKRG
ncbi:type II toxin-antitoxin system VapC family toxin [Gemmatimonas sp.]|uniref:type II toxin-antitoxin system VapC family toxin n=1 Tax=Gemmatimonas sp. TaxID=1962908 RepID=UPI0039837C6F